MKLLSFSKANSKLRPLETLTGERIATFQIPAGRHGRVKTCPGAADCLAHVVETDNGKRQLIDGKGQRFRCYAASIAAQYPQTFDQQKRNLAALRDAKTADNIADLIVASVKASKAGIFRWHTAGDFFNGSYLRGLYVAFDELARDGRRAYFYTKSAHLLAAEAELKPANVSVTASMGGRYDQWAIDHGIRKVRVYGVDAPAGMPIDHDDRHALEPNVGTYGGTDFGLQVHGTQQKGTWGSGELIQLRRDGVKTGYSRAS